MSDQLSQPGWRSVDWEANDQGDSGLPGVEYILERSGRVNVEPLRDGFDPVRTESALGIHVSAHRHTTITISTAGVDRLGVSLIEPELTPFPRPRPSRSEAE